MKSGRTGSKRYVAGRLHAGRAGRVLHLLAGLCLFGISPAKGELIQAGDAAARPGARVLLAVRLPETTNPCAGVNARIDLPTQIEVTRVIRGQLLQDEAIKLYSHASGHTVCFLAYSTTRSFSGPGVLVMLELDVSGSASNGTYPIAFHGNTIGPVNWQCLAAAGTTASLVPATLGGSLTVDNGIRPVDAWLAGYFAQAEINAWPDPMQADPDGDHRSNLAEYLFGGDPRAFEHASPFEGSTVSGGAYTFTGMVRSDDPSLQYTLEFSSDLLQWEGHALVYGAGGWESPGSFAQIQAELLDASGVWVLAIEIPAVEAYRFARIACEP